jgi:cytochrome c oxidase cbb3-type subunit IV
MNIYSVLGTITTVLSFVAFLGIVAWAWSGRRRKAFEDAANAPFALPDDGAGDGAAADQPRAERRS